MGTASHNVHSDLFCGQPIAAGGDPLFVQIADGVRYGIGTGRLTPGDRLPAADVAAAAWGINHHTVRRAYGVLAGEGLITVQPRLGAKVRHQNKTGGEAPVPLSVFLDAILHQARMVYGLDPQDVADLIRTHRTKIRRRGAVVVMECTTDQAAHHGEELADTFGMDSIPFCLDGQDEPPSGPILGTYFHLSEIAARWPHRMGDVIVVAVEPSHEIADQVNSSTGARSSLLLHETNPIRAELMADQLRQMPALKGTPITIELSDTVEASRAPIAEGIHLYAPKNWVQLEASARQDRQHKELPFQITSQEVERLAPLFDRLP